MRIPAFCDTCGTIFPSGFNVGGETVTLIGNRSGPCPACGGMGRVPDGIFSTIGNMIQILSAPQQTIDDLSRLNTILHEAREKKEEPDVATQQIRKLFPALADMLPRDRTEFLAYLTIIIMVINLIIQSVRDTNSVMTVTVNQTINHIYIDTNKPTKLQPKQEQTTKNVGRNEPCPCGSGKKYKKCCGMIQ